MRIPRRFKLFGQTIEVVRKIKDPTEKRDCIAFASYRCNQIQIRQATEDYPLTDEQIEHAFCHELIHYLLYHSAEQQGEKWLHQDERLVDCMAGLLHQALTTMEYAEETP
jgi:hypothetical protein